MAAFPDRHRGTGGGSERLQQTEGPPGGCWRDAPEADLKPEDHQLFRDLGSACLAQGDSAQVLDFLQDERNQGFVKSMGCGFLAPLVREVVRKEESASHCQAAITHLTRMEEEKASSLGSTLAALQKQMLRLPVPYTQQQEDDDAHGLCRCCAALTAFIEPFVEEVKRKDGSGDTTTADDELKTELLKFCMRSLRDPLLQAELVPGRKSPLWLFATEIVMTLHTSIQEPLAELLLYSPLRRSMLMDGDQWDESRASLAYLLFVQLITMERFPAVFSPVFVLQCNMEHINILLSRKDESYVLKGLALYSKSLESVQDNSLPVDLLELKSFYSVPQNMRQVLTDCPIQHLRERGLQVFQLFITKLDTEAKHKFFRCMLRTSSHAGVEGYIVKNIRNQVELSIKMDNENEWFLGVEFVPLLALVLCLPRGSETDLLHGMDRIMECLNLLRYLLIRDKHLRSKSGVWSELCRMKDEYLKMLRVCISISRAYYSSEAKALREDQKLKAKEARAAARSTGLVRRITAKHQNESDMSPEVQHQVLQSALVTFDLMESLIFRIEEITKEKEKNQS
ncbi:glomulin, FKBP associated protein b [Diretmus argenteus]